MWVQKLELAMGKAKRHNISTLSAAPAHFVKINRACTRVRGSNFSDSVIVSRIINLAVQLRK